MIPQAQRLTRRHGLARDLELQEARRALLNAKLEQAKVRAAEATAALNAALARSSHANEECARIRQLLAFDPDIINSLPVELLTAIWRELWCTLEDSNWLEDGSEARGLNALRVITPDRLAAVCRHWRNVALNTPELWTHISLPRSTSSPRQVDSMLDLVRRLLARSRPLGLHIELSHRQWLAHPSEDPTTGIASVLPIVAQDAYRWRTVKLRVHTRLHIMTLLDDLLLNRPTPLLEEFHVVGLQETMESPWLSKALSLKALSTRGVKFQPPPMLRLSTVVSAHIDVYMNELDHLWRALSALPSLRRLSLLKVFTRLNTITPPTIRHTLPFLECLKLRGGGDDFIAFASVLPPGLSAPRLKKLNIWADAIAKGVVLGEAFFDAFPTIIDIELVGPSQRPLFPSGSLSDFDRNGHSPTPARPPAYLCAELESVEIRWAPHSDTSDQVLAELLSFLHTRAVFCAMHGKQFSFALLDWPEPSIPSWFRAGVGCLLGPAHVRLATADGVEHAPVADEGEEEEPEAQFTDSGDDSSESQDSSSDSNECGSSDGEDNRWWVIESDGSQSS